MGAPYTESGKQSKATSPSQIDAIVDDWNAQDSDIYYTSALSQALGGEYFEPTDLITEDTPSFIESDVMKKHPESYAGMPRVTPLEGGGYKTEIFPSHSGSGKNYFNFSADDAHLALGAAGWLNPGADVVDALLYLAEGELFNAALSGFAIIPVAGDIVKRTAL